MKISYGLTVCNEIVELQKLVSFLSEHKRNEDEIIVVFDSVGGSDDVFNYLQTQKEQLKWYPFPFRKDFSELKNYLNSWCTGDFIFQLDADEIPNSHLIENLPFIIENNYIDLLWVPRINTVEGITNEHIKEWGWKINDKGWINWPGDYQGRIYKNTPIICWSGKVHEKIIGHKTHTQLPATEEWAIYHPKTIKKQEKQNELYFNL